MATPDYPAISPLQTAFTHRCPQCGIGSLYVRVLMIRPACSHCGLSFEQHDVGDGPAFFTIILLGFLVVGLSVYLEVAMHLSLLMNLSLSIGLLLLLMPASLRFFKSYLIAYKYKLHWSKEGA